VTDQADGVWGGYNVKMDDKWRVIVPAAARHLLAGGTVLTRGKDRCVYLFSKSQFASFSQKVEDNTPEAMPPTAFDRLFYFSVVQQNMDKQGRITIPSGLRSYASLERDLMVVGLGGRLEIWDSAEWEAFQDQYMDQFVKSFEGVR
jgi:MraZ protein